MKKKRLGFLVVMLLTILNVSAQETFKVMFYNLLNYPLENAVPNREDDLEFILSDYQPDLFLVCELNNSTGANNVLGITRTAVSPDFEMATYISNVSDNSSGDQNDLQNLMYYNSSKFILVDENIVTTDLRDFNIYRLRLNTTDSDTNPKDVFVIVCHLKASSGSTNETRRFEMVQELEGFLDTLPAASNVVLAGDLNVYRASEAAFQELTDNNNNITFVDPVNRIGSWSNNPGFSDVFTQSTRTQSGFGGTTGGFDDRFDFILTSENMLNSADITYVPNSYQVYGNNGLSSCYNRRINSLDCGNSSSQFSFAIRDALHNFSDHLPVTLSLQANATLSVDPSISLQQNIFIDKSLVNSELILNINQTKPGLAFIYNQLGQKIDTITIDNVNRYIYNTTQLENGVYLITFSNTYTRPIKFVVAH